MQTVHFLSRQQIDTHQWDNFLRCTPRNIVYAQSWYLDTVADRWGALVLTYQGDWQAVMPVPFRQKFGFWVVHQPHFCQFLGVFALPNTQVEPIIDAFYAKFRYVSTYSFHPDNKLVLDYATCAATHVLNVTSPLPYTTDRRNNLKKAMKADWTLVESTDSAPIIQLFKQNHTRQIEGGVAEAAYQTLRQLSAHTKILYALKNGQIEAGAMFLIFERRIIYIFNAASVQGRIGNARTLLIDHVLTQPQYQGFVFDFESPSLPSITAHYASFGAMPQTYLQIRYSRLPFIFKQLQRTSIFFRQFFRRNFDKMT